MGKEKSFDGTALKPEEVAFPCGLYAYTYFEGLNIKL